MSWQLRSFLALALALIAVPLSASQPWTASIITVCALGLGLGVIAGAVAAVGYPGWGLLTIAPGMVATGFWRGPIAGEVWLSQALAGCCLLVTYLVGYNLALKVRGDDGPAWVPYPESSSWRVFFGLASISLCSLTLALLLLPTLAQAAVVVLPWAALAAAVSAAQFPRLSPSWTALGAVAAVPTAFCLGAHVLAPMVTSSTQDHFPTPAAFAYPFDVLYLPPADPWMLCGLALLGALPACWWLDQQRLRSFCG